MRQRLFVLMFLLIAIPLVVFSMVLAQDTGCKPTSSNDANTLEAVIQACENQLQTLGKKRDTLASQIKYMDTQSYVTELEINKNTSQIETLTNEINNLGNRITELDTTLTNVSKAVNKKIEETYKQQQNTNTFLTFFNANNLPSLLRAMQYLQQTQKNDRNLLLKVQDTKVNFQEQKVLREEKEVELQKLTEKLREYKIMLAEQKAEKRRLLEVTQNDETTFQQILAQAQAQVAAFKSFSSSSNNSSIVGANALGTGYDGSYYSQRDERWALHTIGQSSEVIRDVGCLITSVAMVLKSKGANVTPADIASNNSYFFGDTAYMLYRYQISLPNGLHGQTISVGDIDNQINSNAVIVGLNYGSYGSHFVVLKKKDGDDYTMFDPIYGPDKKFSEHYSKGQIFSAEIIQ